MRVRMKKFEVSTRVNRNLMLTQWCATEGKEGWHQGRTWQELKTLEPCRREKVALCTERCAKASSGLVWYGSGVVYYMVW